VFKRKSLLPSFCVKKEKDNGNAPLFSFVVLLEQRIQHQQAIIAFFLCLRRRRRRRKGQCGNVSSSSSMVLF
jgi:hypothetical protein